MLILLCEGIRANSLYGGIMAGLPQAELSPTGTYSDSLVGWIVKSAVKREFLLMVVINSDRGNGGNMGGLNGILATDVVRKSLRKYFWAPTPIASSAADRAAPAQFFLWTVGIIQISSVKCFLECERWRMYCSRHELACSFLNALKETWSRVGCDTSAYWGRS